MSAMTDVGGGVGGVAGGLIGGALGGLFGPIGAIVGRYVGGAVGRAAGAALAGTLENWIDAPAVSNDMADAEAKAKAKAEAKAAVDTCNGPECKNEERCLELRKKIENQIGRLRTKGGGGGEKGIIYRIMENICGEHGPYEPLDRPGNPRNFWERHYDAIEAGQTSIERRWKEYQKLNCDKREDNTFDQSYIDKWTDRSINPTKDQWLGPNDPKCMSTPSFDSFYGGSKLIS